MVAAVRRARLMRTTTVVWSRPMSGCPPVQSRYEIVQRITSANSTVAADAHLGLPQGPERMPISQTSILSAGIFLVTPLLRFAQTAPSLSH
jgi:hypothetical protein